MQVMTTHEWFDEDIERVLWESHKDVREIVLKLSNEGAILITKDDVIALAKEFKLVVYDRDASL